MKPFIHFRAIILLGVDFAFCSSSSSIIKQFQAIMYLDEKFYGNSDHSMSISHIANEYDRPNMKQGVKHHRCQTFK